MKTVQKKKIMELIKKDRKRIEKLGDDYTRIIAIDAHDNMYSHEIADETKYLTIPKLREIYENVERASEYTLEFVSDSQNKGYNGNRIVKHCIDDIPELIKGLSEEEQNSIVAQLALNLPRQVSLGMDYSDGVHHYLQLARVSKLFGIKMFGGNYKTNAKNAVNGLEHIAEDPSRYGMTRKSVLEWKEEIKKEFELNVRR